MLLVLQLLLQKNHLSGEIVELQNELQKKIEYCNYILNKYNLPVVSNSKGPIFFIGVGLTRVGYNMVRRVMDDGYYINLGIFPAVPETCTGLRFTITNHLTFEDIENLGKSIAYHLPRALKEEGRTMKDIYRAFRKVVNMESLGEVASENKDVRFKIEKYNSIKEVDKEEWDRLLGHNVYIDWENLSFFEEVFSNNEKQEDNWDFTYYIIRDLNGHPLLATFFTLALMKEDMLSSEDVSKKIELERIKSDPYYLTSRCFMMGSLISEGQHLFIDKQHPLWKDVLMRLLDEVWKEQEIQKASLLFLRDFNESDDEIRRFFLDQGFIKVGMPETNTIENIRGVNEDEFFKKLSSSKKRQYFRRDIKKKTHLFSVEFNDVKEGEIEAFYKLYTNVYSSSLKINTFKLPVRLFENIVKSEKWDIIKIKYGEENTLVGVVFCLKTKDSYCPVLIGLDYTLDESLNLYKQSLYQMIKRGIELGVNDIFLGLSANVAKHQLGAKSQKQVAYIQRKDDYNTALIESMN